MPFKMKYKNLEEVADQLDSAVKAHGKQAKIIEKHIDSMEDSPMDRKVSWMYGGKKYSGEGIVTSKSISASFDGMVEASFSIQTTGAIVEADA